MPRTIESIVRSHSLAAERRKAGLPSWAASVQFRAVLNRFRPYGDKLSKDQAVDFCHSIAKALRKGVPAAWLSEDNGSYSFEFEELLEEFEQATVASFTASPDWDCTPVEAVNALIDQLYDWADEHRVWLG